MWQILKVMVINVLNKCHLNIDFDLQLLEYIIYPLFIDDGEQSTSLFKESYYENRNRCLGKYWQEIPAYIILLEKIQGYANEKSNCSQVNVTVVKSSTLSKRDQKCVLKISNLGVT